MSIGNELQKQISILIRKTLNFEVPGSATDLIESGLIDSMGLVSLVVELEQEFDCEIPLDAFDLECFRSVDRIADFMASALAGRGAGSAPVIDARQRAIEG
jgi:acyl carrier protein